MPNENETLSAELISAVKDEVEKQTGVEFIVFLQAYLKKNSDQPELDGDDLVAEILEAGEYQSEEDSGFEDAVLIGATAIGQDFGLF